MESAFRMLATRGFTWVDALDVACVALLLYFVFAHVRGTRAAQMAAGVALLGAASLVAGALKFSTTHRILQNLMFYIPFAVIVLFQDVIQRALASLGGAFFGRKARGGAAARCSKEVARACFALAKRRHGALLLFERTQGLRNFEESGVDVGAPVTADLLLTLFFPGTPMHDGAALISDGQIRAAGCFLPLTDRDLPLEFGTRHRAAVGATEQTDAVCVVVSEERGSVLLSVEGVLEPMGTEGELEARLAHLLSGGGRREKPAVAPAP